MSGDPLCELRVASGPNQDACAPLPAGRHRIGSDFGGDFVLAGKGVAPRHAALTFAEGEGRTAGVEAIDAPIGLADGGWIGVGETRRLALPAELRLGGTVISLEPLAAADEPGSEAEPRASAAGASARFVASIGVLLALAAGLISYGFKESSAPPQRPQPSTLAAVPPGPGPVSPSAKAQSLRAKLAAMPDLAALTVSEEDGAVILSGLVDPAAAIQIAPVQRWFDTEWAGRGVLVNQVRTQAGEPPPSLAVEAVWRGKPAAYLMVRGERLMVGAVLDDGWRIQSIGPESVMLVRQDRAVAVRY